MAGHTVWVFLPTRLPMVSSTKRALSEKVHHIDVFPVPIANGGEAGKGQGVAKRIDQLSGLGIRRIHLESHDPTLEAIDASPTVCPGCGLRKPHASPR